MPTRHLEAKYPAAAAGRQNPAHLPFKANPLLIIIMLLIILMTSGLMLAALAVRTGALVSSSTTGQATLLAPYLAIMPGQPAAALDAYACHQRYHPSDQAPTCDIFPSDSPFHLITVTGRDDSIILVKFYSSVLQYNDPIREWGEPEAAHRLSDHSLMLNWGDRTYRISAVVFLSIREPDLWVITVSAAD
jgi:hypothetical protein